MKKLTLLFWLCATLCLAQRPVLLSDAAYIIWPGNPATVPVSLSLIGSPVSVTASIKLGPAFRDPLPVSMQPTVSVANGVVSIAWSATQTQAIYSRTQRAYLDIRAANVSIAGLWLDVDYKPLAATPGLSISLNTISLADVASLISSALQEPTYASIQLALAASLPTGKTWQVVLIGDALYLKTVTGLTPIITSQLIAHETN